MKIAIKNLNVLLKKYAYKTAFLPYHSKKELMDYRHKKDAVDRKAYLTLLTPSGHVMGRLFGITKKYRYLSEDHLKVILDFFGRYDISDRKKIIKELESLLHSV